MMDYERKKNVYGFNDSWLVMYLKHILKVEVVTWNYTCDNDVGVLW